MYLKVDGHQFIQVELRTIPKLGAIPMSGVYDANKVDLAKGDRR